MKTKSFRNFTALVLSLAVVVCSASTTVFAAGENYMLGDTPMTVNADDQFGIEFKELMPGDVKERTVQLTNRTEYKQEVFLKALPQQQSQEPALFELQAELLRRIELKLWLGNVLMFWGNGYGEAEIYGTPNDMLDWLPMGKIAKNASVALKIEISVPSELGNEYQDLLDSVVWVLHSERVNEWEPDEDDPWEDVVYIPEEEVPLIDLPKTGGAILQK